MGLESIGVGEVVRAPRERLTPGTLISGFTAYDEAISLPHFLARKLHHGLEFAFYSNSRRANPNRDRVLIMEPSSKKTRYFLGWAVPEMGLITPADISLAPAGVKPNLDPEGVAYMLRYGIYATGKDRYKAQWVACSIFREKGSSKAWGFGRPGTINYLNKLIREGGQEYAQALQEGREALFPPTK